MVARPACKSYSKASSSLLQSCLRAANGHEAVALTTAYGKKDQDALENHATEVRGIETRRTDATRQARSLPTTSKGDLSRSSGRHVDSSTDPSGRRCHDCRRRRVSGWPRGLLEHGPRIASEARLRPRPRPASGAATRERIANAPHELHDDASPSSHRTACAWSQITCT